MNQTKKIYCSKKMSESKIPNIPKTINFDELKTYILNRVKKVGDHLIWISEYDELLTVELPRRIANFHVDKSPTALLFMYQNRIVEMDTNIRLIRICEVAMCIWHCVESHVNMISVTEMNDYDYEKACIRFNGYCSPQNQVTKCIDFNGSTNQHGYGNFGFLGHSTTAHRAAWQLANGKDIPDQLIVRHQCVPKNKLCVNPDHLILGTDKDNARDEINGGYVKRGADCRAAKITEEKALEIIASYKNGKTQIERAEQFDVSTAIIGQLDNAKTWKHLFSEEDLKKRIKEPLKALSREEVLNIRQFSKSNSVQECANRFDVSTSTIRDILFERSHQFVHEDLETEQKNIMEHELKRKDKYFEKTKNRIKNSSTLFIDENNNTHWLWKNDKSQNSRVKYYRTWLFSDVMHVHQVSYMSFNKLCAIDPSKVIRHKCKYKHCVNPDCLELGTYLENAMDRIRDGTSCRGEKHSQVTIDEQTATKIKQTKGIMTKKERSIAYGVSYSIVKGIDCGKSWKHVKVEKPDTCTENELRNFIQEKNKKRKLED